MFKKLSKKLGLYNIQKFEIEISIEELETQIEKHSAKDTFFLSLFGLFFVYWAIKTPFDFKRLGNNNIRLRIINRPSIAFYSYCTYLATEEDKLNVKIETIGISGLIMKLFVIIIFVQIIALSIANFEFVVNFPLKFIMLIFFTVLIGSFHYLYFKWLMQYQYTQIAKYIRIWEKQYQNDINSESELT